MGKIKKIVNHLALRHGTRDPFQLAKDLGISILYCTLGNTLGYTVTYKRIPVIVLNEGLDERLMSFVCAHELGHAVMHKNVNTQWLKRHTFFSIDRYEREANTFAVELLFYDELVTEHYDTALYSIATSLGIPSGLEELKTLKRINFYKS